MKHIVLVVGTILIVAGLVAGVGFMLANQNEQTQSTEDTSSLLPQGASITDPVPQTQEDTDALLAGGSSFLDPNGVFTILYPNDYKLDTTDPKHPRIYKQGATQRGQTEMYDGTLIVLETIDLGGQTLSQWVDTQMKNATADGTSEVVKAKTATTFNDYPGFIYTLRGLGTSDYLVIQKDTNSDNAVVITTLVADPEAKGYQKEVDATLATIELLK